MGLSFGVQYPERRLRIAVTSSFDNALAMTLASRHMSFGGFPTRRGRHTNARLGSVDGGNSLLLPFVISRQIRHCEINPDTIRVRELRPVRRNHTRKDGVILKF